MSSNGMSNALKNPHPEVAFSHIGDDTIAVLTVKVLPLPHPPMRARKDIMAIFPHPVLTTVQGEPDYQTIHPTRKFLQANSRAIDTYLGGGTLGHLGLIISDASYAMIAPTTDDEPTFWITPNAPGRAPATKDGTKAHISAAPHIWEEDVQTYRTCTSVQQALKKKIISVFEPMYLDILNDNMVGYANISARGMLDHFFET
jgi:hypothetical protein